MSIIDNSSDSIYRSIIGLGEKINIEFKSFPNAEYKKSKSEVPSRILKACVGLANTEGGQLFIGIDDNGKVIGIDDDIDAYRLITSIRKEIHPFLDIELADIRIDDKRVLVLRIDSPREHKQIYSTGNVAYMRRMRSHGDPETCPLESV